MAADPWLPTWEVLGVTERTVDHDRIDVRHVRMVIADEDDYCEHTVVDWYVAEDGLPVEMSSVKSAVITFAHRRGRLPRAVQARSRVPCALR